MQGPRESDDEAARRPAPRQAANQVSDPAKRARFCLSDWLLEAILGRKGT